MGVGAGRDLRPIVRSIEAGMCETLSVGSACQTQGLNYVSCYRGNSYLATMRPIQPSLFLSGYHQAGVATQPVSCLPGMRLEGISSVAWLLYSQSED